MCRFAASKFDALWPFLANSQQPQPSLMDPVTGVAPCAARPTGLCSPQTSPAEAAGSVLTVVEPSSMGCSPGFRTTSCAPAAAAASLGQTTGIGSETRGVQANPTGCAGPRGHGAWGPNPDPVGAPRTLTGAWPQPPLAGGGPLSHLPTARAAASPVAPAWVRTPLAGNGMSTPGFPCFSRAGADDVPSQSGAPRPASHCGPGHATGMPVVEARAEPGSAVGWWSSHGPPAPAPLVSTPQMFASTPFTTGSGNAQPPSWPQPLAHASVANVFGRPTAGPSPSGQWPPMADAYARQPRPEDAVKCQLPGSTVSGHPYWHSQSFPGPRLGPWQTSSSYSDYCQWPHPGLPPLPEPATGSLSVCTNLNWATRPASESTHCHWQWQPETGSGSDPGPGHGPGWDAGGTSGSKLELEASKSKYPWRSWRRRHGDGPASASDDHILGYNPGRHGSGLAQAQAQWRSEAPPHHSSLRPGPLGEHHHDEPSREPEAASGSEAQVIRVGVGSGPPGALAPLAAVTPSQGGTAIQLEVVIASLSAQAPTHPLQLEEPPSPHHDAASPSGYGASLQVVRKRMRRHRGGVPNHHPSSSLSLPETSGPQVLAARAGATRLPQAQPWMTQIGGGDSDFRVNLKLDSAPGPGPGAATVPLPVPVAVTVPVTRPRKRIRRLTGGASRDGIHGDGASADHVSRGPAGSQLEPPQTAASELIPTRNQLGKPHAEDLERESFAPQTCPGPGLRLDLPVGSRSGHPQVDSDPTWNRASPGPSPSRDLRLPRPDSDSELSGDGVPPGPTASATPEPQAAPVEPMALVPARMFFCTYCTYKSSIASQVRWSR
jgi:hypothetical protein